MLIIGLAAGFAYAHRSGHGSGNGQGWDREAHQKFFNETDGLRREIHNKRFDYMEVQRNPNTTRAELAQIEKEIWDIQAQIREKIQQMR